MYGRDYARIKRAWQGDEEIYPTTEAQGRGRRFLILHLPCGCGTRGAINTMSNTSNRDIPELSGYRDFMMELVRRSGEFIKPYFGSANLAVEMKGDASPVTAADRGAEELMRGLIAKKFPSHACTLMKNFILRILTTRRSC